MASVTAAAHDESDDEDENAPLVSPCKTGSDAAATAAAVQRQDEEEEDMGWWIEVKDLLRLSVPIFISRVSGTAKAVTDTALVGHIDTDSRYLLASAMSDMWTQSTGVLMNGRVLGTFCSQAFGAGNKQLAGVWLQVSLFVVGVIAVPVAILWGSTHWVLHSVLGQPEQISSDAAYYSTVMLAGIPARLIFGQTSQFLQAQRIMRPAAQLSVLTCVLNLAAGWYFVLGLPGPLSSLGGGYGFIAMPIVTLFCEYVQCVLLLLYFCWYKGLHRECWPDDGLSSRHITRRRTSQYIRLYMPAAIVGASDWWRVAAIGAIAVTLGDKELAVFNSSYRVLWLANIFNGALSGAMGVKLGMALGAGQPKRAKKLCIVSMAVALTVSTLIGTLVFSFARELGSLFSNDPELIELYHDVRLPLAAMMVTFAMAVFLERIPMTMGRTKLVMNAGLLGSWIGQVPGVYLCTRYWRRDGYGMYVGVALGYGMLDILLLLYIWRTDFQLYADKAMARSEVKVVKAAK